MILQCNRYGMNVYFEILDPRATFIGHIQDMFNAYAIFSKEGRRMPPVQYGHDMILKCPYLVMDTT